MNRRKFISAFSKVSLVTAAAGGASSAAMANDDSEKPDTAMEGLSARFEEMRKRVDALEEDQKDWLRAVCMVMAVSTGIDLSFLV